MANIGLFYAVKKPPVVPDVLLSMDVDIPDEMRLKEHRSYFTWEYAKVPEVGIEVVSNLEGGELGDKKKLYAQIGVLYYIVWDPDNLLGQGRLLGFVLSDKKSYKRLKELWFAEVGLGLTIWHGTFEKKADDWLRWCDKRKKLIPTADERAEKADERADRLAAKLRSLGIDPDA